MGVIQIFSIIQNMKRICQCGLVVISLSLLVSGCADHWKKAGATAEMFDHDHDACEKYARERAPPRMRYERNPPKMCKQKGFVGRPSKRVPCGSSFDSIKEIDDNEGSRRRFYKSCMRNGGWSSLVEGE